MIELKATDLQRITCQLTLFNRQRYKLYNGTTERIVYDFSGRNLLINPVSFETEQDMEHFFRQVKLIYFDGKVVGYRGCSELSLKLECRAFQKMVKRQKMLLNAPFNYKVFEENEFREWCEKMRSYK